MKNIYHIVILTALTACSTNSEKQKDKLSPKTEDLPKITQNESPNKTNSATATIDPEMIRFEAGTFIMGSNEGLPQEQPAHEVSVKPFLMDKTPVTVAQFEVFVKATGYKTEAEGYGDSGVFNLEIKNWELLKGAYWLKPFGPKGSNAIYNHPVTHVSWNDAFAFAKWAGKRLPTEIEWEYAARSGGKTNTKFSWGNEVAVQGKYFANTWQGTLEKPENGDGHLYTSPVDAFDANAAGLYDMGGNVWQWCADVYKAYPGSQAVINVDSNVKVIRSGSFFYDQYGEDSFSVSGRSGNSHETSLFNTGFRCAKDI